MFWQNYLKYCNKVELSPNAVAAKVGIKSTGTVTGWKKGAKPRQNVLLALADFFKCSVDDLMGDEQIEIPAATEGDGMSDQHQELIRLIPTMTQAEVSVLLATARGQVAARTIPDSPSQSE